MKEEIKAWKKVYHIALVFTLFILLFTAAQYLVEKTGSGLTGAVTYATKTSANSTLVLFDQGDQENTTTRFGPLLEVNNLFNDTSNVFFFANLTNGTGQNVVTAAGSACGIQFSADAGGNTGPFTMNTNTQLNLFEYNRSFPRNGTFSWNVTCQNTAAGIGPLNATDSVRIFGPGCSAIDDSLGDGQNISNNTILCGGIYKITPQNQPTLNITNRNITLDCNGSIIMTEGTANVAGAVMNTRHGFIMKNCILENLDPGVRLMAGANKTLIYNSTFKNMSTGAAVNITSVNDVVLSLNNFTANVSNRSRVAWIQDGNNINITSNIFRINASRQPVIYFNTTNLLIANNTLEISLIAPLNNTDQNDINFTYLTMTAGFNLTCDLLLNTTLSGKVLMGNETPNAQNVTINTSRFVRDELNWQINCSDQFNNTGSTLFFNTTYRACTIPSRASVPSSGSNVTFCPGTFEINATDGNLPLVDLNNRNDVVVQ